MSNFLNPLTNVSVSVYIIFQSKRVACKNMSSNPYRDRIIVGSIYKYKTLCNIMGEDVKTSNSKTYQLKRWKGYFDWINPTKQTYKITEIYDSPIIIEDGRKNNGGSRKGSGAKLKLQEEFDYLFNMFLHREFNRNVANGQGDICSTHFFNSEISKYFGLYGDRFYNAKQEFSDIVVGHFNDNDKIVTKISSFNSSWDDIAKKIIEKRNSWVYKKIERIDGIEFGYGIIAYKNDKDFEYHDEWLDRWNGYMKDYLRIRKMRTISDVVDMGLWDDMVSYISGFFDGYEKVERTRLVKFNVDMLCDYDYDVKDVYRKRYNDKICDDVLRYFNKRVDEEEYRMYEYIVKQYVRLS